MDLVARSYVERQLTLLLPLIVVDHHHSNDQQSCSPTRVTSISRDCAVARLLV